MRRNKDKPDQYRNVVTNDGKLVACKHRSP